MNRDEVPDRLCTHPFMVHPVANEAVAPAKVVGTCSHNWSCPVCGWGHGQWPDPCRSADDQREVQW